MTASPRTLVLQSCRGDVPAWVRRCLDSARRWANMQGYGYENHGGDVRALFGAAFLERAAASPETITSLARLELARIRLSEGVGTVIWLDAGVFVFDPAHFILPGGDGFAFCQNVPAPSQTGGAVIPHRNALHDAAFFFRGNETGLDLLIHVIRHAVMTRTIAADVNLAAQVINGLADPLQIPAFTNCAVLPAEITKAIARGDTQAMAALAAGLALSVQAAHLCPGGPDRLPPDIVTRAMDRLESGAGAILHTLAGPLPAAVAGSAAG